MSSQITLRSEREKSFSHSQSGSFSFSDLTSELGEGVITVLCQIWYVKSICYPFRLRYVSSALVVISTVRNRIMRNKTDTYIDLKTKLCVSGIINRILFTDFLHSLPKKIEKLSIQNKEIFYLQDVTPLWVMFFCFTNSVLIYRSLLPRAKLYQKPRSIIWLIIVTLGVIIKYVSSVQNSQLR